MMMTLDQIDLADLDFFVNRDIHEAFRVLRREDPVHWQEKQPGRGFWSLTKYDDILAVYRDPLGFSSAQGREPVLRRSLTGPEWPARDDDHDRFRRAIRRCGRWSAGALPRMRWRRAWI
jgi:cytochrome P450